MEHKKAMDNRAASAAEKALRDKKELELGPPTSSDAPTPAPGEWLRIKKDGRIIKTVEINGKLVAQSYEPPLAPGDMYLVRRGNVVVSLPSMRKKKKLRQSQA